MQNIRVQLLYTSNVHTAYVHTWKRYGMRARRVSIFYKTRITLSKWTTIDTDYVSGFDLQNDQNSN